jgi:hypothetical protein
MPPIVPVSYLACYVSSLGLAGDDTEVVVNHTQRERHRRLRKGPPARLAMWRLPRPVVFELRNPCRDFGREGINVCEKYRSMEVSDLFCLEVDVSRETTVEQRLFIQEWSSIYAESSTHSARLHEV